MTSREHVSAQAPPIERGRLCSAARAVLDDALLRVAPLSPNSRLAIVMHGRGAGHRVAAATGLSPEYVEALSTSADELLASPVVGRDEVAFRLRDLRHGASARLREAALAAGVRAMWSVPVEVDGARVGELTAHVDVLAEPSTSDVAWATTLARLAGMLIEQHHGDERCGHADQQFLQQEITRALLGAETPVDVAMALLQWARRGLGASGGLVLWHRHGENLEVLASDGAVAEVDEAGEHAVWVEAMRHGHDSSCQLTPPPLRHGAGGRTRVLLPLTAGTTLAALLELTFPAGQEPDASVLQLLGDACTTSAQALERARLHEAERRAAARIGLMAEAARVLSEASLDLDVVLDAFSRLLTGSLADCCVVRLLSHDGAWLDTSCVHHRVAEHEDVLRRALLGRRSRAHSRMADAVVSTGALVTTASSLFDEWSESLDADELAELRRLPCDVAAVAPLRIEQRVLGWMAVCRTQPAQSFSSDDLAVLRELASRAAMAIDNARLHRDSLRAVQIRDDFVSVAGHELKTPLTALHLQAHMLVKTASDSSPRIRQHGERILQQAERLARLVDELLDVSRIASGRLHINVERFDLRALVLDAARRLSADLERAGCELIVDASEPLLGSWDRLRVDQVVSNLLSNAAKYGAGKPVSLSLRRHRGSAVLTVVDHGIGIAPEDQLRIFERFERAVSARRFGGLGLGLWIARQIVEAHGGSISVASHPGQGSTFTVELPAKA